jgi:hypothetical protein
LAAAVSGGGAWSVTVSAFIRAIGDMHVAAAGNEFAPGSR